jgi:ATP-dependent Zn protease
MTVGLVTGAMSRQQEKILSCHEAAHAVAFCKLLHGIDVCRITPNPEGDGYIGFVRGANITESATKEEMQSRFVCSLVGPVLEAWITGEGYALGDLALLAKDALRWGLNSEQFYELLGKAHAAAVDFVRTHLDQIEKVGRALYEKKTLSNDEVKSLIGE